MRGPTIVRPKGGGVNCDATGNADKLGVLENGGVKLGGLLGLIVEPQAWGNSLNHSHSSLLVGVVSW